MGVADLASPDRLWSAGEVLARPSPVPAEAGVYGWYFDEAPHPGLRAGRLLNLDQNRHNGFHPHLKELRAQARQRARVLSVLT